MNRAMLLLVCLWLALPLRATAQTPPVYPTFDHDTVLAHEIKPHEIAIKVEELKQGGVALLPVKLIVSPSGEVVDVKTIGNRNELKSWPLVEALVRQWKYVPFEVDGKPVTAEVEDRLVLLPPERLPTVHVSAPMLRPDSKVTITLQRSACFGKCPAYSVAISTDGIIFDGYDYVEAYGRHTGKVNADEARKLAKKFIDADFYSMNADYSGQVTDAPSCTLSIDIDGQKKVVRDYAGRQAGIPEVIQNLEVEVDAVAQTQRWIEGGDALVSTLQSEGFNFHSFYAQIILKKAINRGESALVHDLLRAGVPLDPLPAPSLKDMQGSQDAFYFSHVGWLNAASSHPEILQVFLDANASLHDQNDKDAALAGAAFSGNVLTARKLIAYGANPNADLSKLYIAEGSEHLSWNVPGSVLIYAAKSLHPDLVSEILLYHPNLELKDEGGHTALFAAAADTDEREEIEGARVQCILLLAQAGANVNARDRYGNSALAETYYPSVEEELIKLGADVNARNNNGETPIFTSGNDVIPILIQHGADLTIRNNKGKTVFDVAKERHDQQRLDALNKAIQDSAQH